MIIGTAGHIDHGKTSLVKALTGVDADRLPEEKKRGITIELGFAYAPTSSGEMIGFVDVPGHEKFVHTMAAGACGMDHGLIVIAADDGIMPQTREHLRILDLLGIPGLTVAINKSDLVDDDRLRQVQYEIKAELAQSRFSTSPLFTVSSHTGAGIDSLRNHLFAINRCADKKSGDYFRLAVDRVFVVKGMGVGITGAVISGHVQVGDLLVTSGSKHRVKVRSIHAQNQYAERAEAGSRCGIVLSGIEVKDIERGEWLLSEEISDSSKRIDCKLFMPADSSRSLKDGELVLLHHGTTHVSARMILLDAAELLPGQTCKAQCVLSRALPFCWGDRLVLRDGSARHTLAGARVLDTDPPVRGRKRSERLSQLDAIDCADSHDAIAALLLMSDQPLNMTHWAHATNQSFDSLKLILKSRIAESHIVDSQSFICSQSFVDDLNLVVHRCLEKFHLSDPDEPGLGVERLRRMCRPDLTQQFFHSWIKSRIEQGAVVTSGSFIHLPEHQVVLSELEQSLWDKAYPVLLEGGFDAPWVRDVAHSIDATEDAVRLLFRKQARQSHLTQVVKDLFYPQATMNRIADTMQYLVSTHGFITVVHFRDSLGIGRKRAIQILEALDRIGFSRRLISVSRSTQTTDKDQRIIRNANLFG